MSWVVREIVGARECPGGYVWGEYPILPVPDGKSEVDRRKQAKCCNNHVLRNPLIRITNAVHRNDVNEMVKYAFNFDYEHAVGGCFMSTDGAGMSLLTRS